VVNWTNEPRSFKVELEPKVLATVPGERVLVFEFVSQQILGLFGAGSMVDLGLLEPHSSRVLRITTWDGQAPVLAGTDLHFSGGGVDIGRWQAAGDSVMGSIDTPWITPLRVTVAFPVGSGFVEQSVVSEPGQEHFRIARP